MSEHLLDALSTVIHDEPITHILDLLLPEGVEVLQDSLDVEIDDPIQYLLLVLVILLLLLLYMLIIIERLGHVAFVDLRGFHLYLMLHLALSLHDLIISHLALHLQLSFLLVHLRSIRMTYNFLWVYMSPAGFDLEYFILECFESILLACLVLQVGDLVDVG